MSAAEPGEQDRTGPVGVSPLIGADGRPQAMAERCSTCILRPGGSSLVPADVVRELVERHCKVGAVVTCHQTLADIPGSCPEIGYSACRGFLDAYPKHGLRQFRRDINDHVGIRYRPQDSSTDPLLRSFRKRHGPSQAAPPAVLRR